MLEFLKKNKDKTSQTDADANATDTNGDDANSKAQHGPDVVGGVPVKLSEVLNGIRGEEEKDFQMVAVDDDGKPLKDEDGNDVIITDASDEEIADAKDGKASSGDANDSSDAAGKDKSVAEADTDDSTGEQVTLDPRLEEAGKKMGWSPDKIISIAETDMSILTDLADRFEANDTQHRQEEDSSEDAQQGDTGLSEDAVAKLKEKFGDEVAEIIIGQTKRNDELTRQLEEVQAFTKQTKDDAKQQAEARKVEVASELFDTASEQFPEFGTTATLPKDGEGVPVLDSPQMKAREAIYAKAKLFHAADGGTFASAMNEALAWHAGRTGTVHAQRAIVKDLNKNKQRFSPKPSRRKMVKVFKNADAKGANIVKEAKRKAGIE
jgi:hypothetical protein